jgi:hypothetical protein
MRGIGFDFKRSREVLITISSFLVLLFWFFGITYNVYEYKVVGAFFEVLWLPMLGLLFVLPIISIVYLKKGKWNLKSLYSICFILNLLSVLFIIFRDEFL